MRGIDGSPKTEHTHLGVLCTGVAFFFVLRLFVDGRRPTQLGAAAVAAAARSGRVIDFMSARRRVVRGGLHN